MIETSPENSRSLASVRQPYSRPGELESEREKRLDELAKEAKHLAVAAAIDIQHQKALGREGFGEFSSHFRRQGDRIAMVQHLEIGNVTVKKELEFPQELIESINSEADPQLNEIRRDLQNADFNSDFEKARFNCGRIWYTLRQEWTAERTREARHRLNLAGATSVKQIENHLHFCFQRLYRKPPDDWSDADGGAWDFLASVIDLQEYQIDNPPTDNRVGLLISADAETVVIRWGSNGVAKHDSRLVPPDLLTAPLGWLIRAEFYCGNRAEEWLSIRIEPPLSSDADVIAADMAEREGTPAAKIRDVEWPKVEV